MLFFVFLDLTAIFALFEFLGSCEQLLQYFCALWDSSVHQHCSQKSRMFFSMNTDVFHVYLSFQMWKLELLRISMYYWFGAQLMIMSHIWPTNVAPLWTSTENKHLYKELLLMVCLTDWSQSDNRLFVSLICYSKQELFRETLETLGV